ncbi:proline racemase family protein [Kribbella sp. NPDC050124]|uniref:proline racemase family protein n=1 Tax=Kribbella sp. NPDC050124 TaxID=3364114 RepID=UPI00379A730E
MHIVETTDYHTAGEPFRIVLHPPEIPGTTVAARRLWAQSSADVDGLRKLLCYEPRGHADMYGGFVTPPDDDGAHFGVLFWHKDGFSTACGHGTIALGTWAIDSGRVPPDPSGITSVLIDVPSGRVTARVHTDASGRPTAVDFVNVSSFTIATALPISTSRGNVEVAVSYGGAIYAQLAAGDVGLAVEPDRIEELIAFGREVKALLRDHPAAQHPTDPHQSGVYGTIFWDESGHSAPGEIRQRNVTVFADGEVDRSPCGSGTSARLATLVAEGRMSVGDSLAHESILGTRFTGTVAAVNDACGRSMVETVTTGQAHRTGEHRFVVDERDALTPGFVLR